jgi:CubicO group peptidase (beta-lactamase class C family)
LKSIFKTKVFKIITSLIILAVLGLVILTLYGKHQMSKIPDLSVSDALEYTTNNNPDAVITVGIIKDGECTFKVYGENAKELPKEQHIYEIGSITKTFTATLISQAAHEGLIDLNDTIDHYLDLPENNSYPTIKSLLTHTSGYKGHYFERPMTSNFFAGRNSFYGITKEMTLHRVGKLSMDQADYPFNYSNFGYAVLGLVLESVYKTDYHTLINEFVQNDLGLKDTMISDGTGDLGNYWDWNHDDAYLSAGALTSNIDDMLSYLELQLENGDMCSSCHDELETISSISKDYETMGINMDAIGMAWIIDKENNIIWHNGGTTDFNSYMGFDLESKTGVIVLSNLPPNYRIPATIMGIKLLDEIND